VDISDELVLTLYLLVQRTDFLFQRIKRLLVRKAQLV
jgi:hypothetical protein